MFPKCGVRVGVQWILPTWIGKSSRRVETQGGTPGMLLPPLGRTCVTDYVKKVCRSERHTDGRAGCRRTDKQCGYRQTRDVLDGRQGIHLSAYPNTIELMNTRSGKTVEKARQGHRTHRSGTCKRSMMAP